MLLNDEYRIEGGRGRDDRLEIIMSEDIKKITSKGESQGLEFKTLLKSKREIGETISAFTNISGEVILVGVSDDGKILGEDIGRKTVEDLASWVKENTDPQIYPDVKIHLVSDRNIIKIAVKENYEKPVFFKNHAFQRVGKTNQRISANKIRELAKQERTKLHGIKRYVKEQL